MQAKVTYECARTINLGNYESTKIHYGLSIDVDIDGKDVAKQIVKHKDKLRTLVDGWVSDHEDEIIGNKNES